LIVSDSSARGVRSAGRIRELVEELEIPVGQLGLIVNMIRPESLEILQPEIEKTGLEVVGTAPYDPLVTEYDLKGEPLWDLPEDSETWQAVQETAKNLDI
jgi:CO dehydrogenase maturation factor